MRCYPNSWCFSRSRPRISTNRCCLGDIRVRTVCRGWCGDFRFLGYRLITSRMPSNSESSRRSEIFSPARRDAAPHHRPQKLGHTAIQPVNPQLGVRPVVQRPPTPRGSILHLLEHRLDQKLAPVGRDDPLIGPFRPVADQDGLPQMGLRDASAGRRCRGRRSTRGWPRGSSSIVTRMTSLRYWRRKIDRHFCLTDARVGRLPPLISPAARPASRPWSSDSRWLAFAISFCKVIHCVLRQLGDCR